MAKFKPTIHDTNSIIMKLKIRLELESTLRILNRCHQQRVLPTEDVTRLGMTHDMFDKLSDMTNLHEVMDFILLHATNNDFKMCLDRLTSSDENGDDIYDRITLRMSEGLHEIHKGCLDIPSLGLGFFTYAVYLEYGRKH